MLFQGLVTAARFRALGAGAHVPLHVHDALLVQVAAGIQSQHAHQALQAMGGAGYLADNPVARIFRDAKLMEIGAGTSEIRRMLVGREMMAAMG